MQWHLRGTVIPAAIELRVSASTSCGLHTNLDCS